MSFLLPHLLKENRGKLDVYFTRVYNPLWTNPDGFSWMEMLTDRDKIGLHVALTPTWSETAWFADYILPMGLGTERHDTMSQETHAAQWLGFRQPVLRVAREKRGETINATYEANPGEVWEESEFWAALTWRIDPDGSLGIRKHFESPYRPGEPVTMDEYYGWMFENSVPGLPEAAAKEALTPLAYMRKYGVFKVKDNVYKPYETPLTAEALAGAAIDRGRGARPEGRRADRRPRRRRAARRLHDAVAPARVPLADAGRLGMAGACGSALRAGTRALARPEARRARVRSAAELPAADARPHAIAGEVALRDLARQPAVDRDAGRAALRHRDRRPRQGPDAHRLLRHARVGHRRHSPRRARDVAPPRTLAAARGAWATGRRRRW